ncbi:hypothetical protein BRD17_01275 [Halobacteriales archaeon SW_7_68_16]|nr:MAG: hypothetical protein BRD17_01275 [Halobacteriales archaeon SW_7_68_16]
MDVPGTEREVDRKSAALATLPFLLLGLADVVLLLRWGLDPLWGFAILPPILFITVLTWIGFKHGFVGDREDAGLGVEERWDGKN